MGFIFYMIWSVNELAMSHAFYIVGGTLVVDLVYPYCECSLEWVGQLGGIGYLNE